MQKEKKEISKSLKEKKSEARAVIGVVALSVLLTIVPQFEGVVHKGYMDPVGIATKCMGDTNNVVVGKTYSKDECLLSMYDQLIAHAEPVIECSPASKDHPLLLASQVSFAYNIGVGAYCKSTTARYLNSSDPVMKQLACERMNTKPNGKPQWVFAGGKILPGLVTRRAKERELCEKGLLFSKGEIVTNE